MSMLSDIEVKTVNAGKFMYILVSGTYEMMEKAVTQLVEWFDQKKIEPSGHLFAIFYDMLLNEETKDIKYEICMQVDREIEGEDVVRFREDFDQECAVIRYNGPYEGINIAYDAVFQWMAEQNYGVNGATREVYVVRPKLGEKVDPGAFVTEIQVPVKKIDE